MTQKIKRLFLGFFFCLLTLAWPHPCSGQNDSQFDTSYHLSHWFEASGNVLIQRQIVLTNKTPDVFARSYIFEINGLRIKNIQAFDEFGPITPEIDQTELNTKIKLFFNEPAVGLNQSLRFQINYQAEGLIEKKGEIWEITAPISDQLEKTDSYLVDIFVPTNFGQLAYISPKPAVQKTDGNYLFFQFPKNTLNAPNIVAAFGQFQVFDFQLNYYLENEEKDSLLYEIALPPDTDFQQVFYTSLVPPPRNVTTDLDGNWLAQYVLKPKEKINIKAQGFAKLFTQPWRPKTTPDPNILKENLKADLFWEIDDPRLKTLAQTLSSPWEIFRFVVNNLNYDYQKITGGNQRLGAAAALAKPNQAICTEFTDLFIALCRAANIPAREINGYAFTKDLENNPSLPDTDILHSWPEYFDPEKEIWVPVDPTWQKTTAGVDYFHKLDLNHFAFAIHGQNSQQPLPAGSYKKTGRFGQDIQITFGAYQKTDPALTSGKFVPTTHFPQTPRLPKFNLQNLGPHALYNLEIKTDTQNFTIEKTNPSENLITILPPFGHQEISPQADTASFLSLSPARLTIQVQNKEYTHHFHPLIMIWPQISLTLGISFLAFGTTLIVIKKVKIRQNRKLTS